MQKIIRILFTLIIFLSSLSNSYAYGAKQTAFVSIAPLNYSELNFIQTKSETQERIVENIANQLDFKIHVNDLDIDLGETRHNLRFKFDARALVTDGYPAQIVLDAYNVDVNGNKIVL